MAIKPDLPKNIEPTEDPEALKHGYRAMLAGMEYALNRILADVNQVRIALGLRELEIKRSDAGLNVKPSNSGITEQGRQKLSDMMKERWKKAHKEGVHVTRLKPDRNGKPETGKKPTHQ